MSERTFRPRGLGYDDTHTHVVDNWQLASNKSYRYHIQDSVAGHKWQILEDVYPVFKLNTARNHGQSPLTPQIFAKNFSCRPSDST